MKDDDDCVICGAPFERSGVVLQHRETGEEGFICRQCFEDYRKAYPHQRGCLCSECGCATAKMDS
jgi:hypothetical protein